MPDELRSQVQPILEAVEAMGLPHSTLSYDRLADSITLPESANATTKRAFPHRRGRRSKSLS